MPSNYPGNRRSKHLLVLFRTTQEVSVSVEPLEILCAEAAVALAPLPWDLMPEYLLSPLHLMCVFKKLN